MAKIHNLGALGTLDLAVLAGGGMRGVLLSAMQAAAQARQLIGQIAQAEAISICLPAAKFADGLRILEISPQAGFEYLSPGLPYVRVGSENSQCSVQRYTKDALSEHEDCIAQAQEALRDVRHRMTVPDRNNRRAAPVFANVSKTAS